MKSILLSLVLALCSVSLFAQEMNVTVNVLTPKLQTTDPKVFQTMESAIKEFINNQKWTDDVFEQDERINCNIQLTIREEVSTTVFKADLAIQATRPVYGSTYETPLITHVDKDVIISYEQFQPITFSKNIFNDNLSSVLSFYVYTILGLDYDSFSPLGGDIYFQTAQELISNIPKGTAEQLGGWTPEKGGRNRFWMMENILSPRVRPYRQAMYNYHIKGLDVMYKDPEAGKAEILKALEELDKVNSAYINSMAIQMFVNAKSSEIIEIFKQASSQQKLRVNQIMVKLDPANSSKYRDIGS